MKKLKKKHTILTAGVCAFGLTAVLLSGLSIYNQLWTPFKEINLSKCPSNTGIIVDYETKIPVKAYVEYGTDPSALLRKDIVQDRYLKTKTVKISHVLPEKEHYVRLTAQTEDGKEFRSDFLKIK